MVGVTWLETTEKILISGQDIFKVLLTAASWGVSFELEPEDEGIEAAVEDDCVETLPGDEVRAGDVLTNIGVRRAARLEEAEAFEGRKGCDRPVEGVAESK